jgi:hypothetical protein
MKKDWLLLTASVAITLGIALGMIRWFAPQLLGISPDLQLVKIDKEAPPFFENTFRAEDAPKSTFPAPEEEHWAVAFKDGLQTVFTPSLRLVSNSDHPAVQAGYKIMADVARLISGAVADQDVKVFFTIIPTKELVYANKVSEEDLQVPQDYQTLVVREKANLEQLAGEIESYPRVVYVDVLQPLQQRAMQAAGLYPEDGNGHPIAPGYEVIGRVLTEAVKPHLSVQRQELAMMEVAPG